MTHQQPDLQINGYAPRRLSHWMLGEFIAPDGLLHPLIVAVREDPDLDLEIRDYYVNIYYHGSNLMEIRQSGRVAERLSTKFDKKYLPEFADNPWEPTQEEAKVHAWLKAQDVLGRLALLDPADVQRHLSSFPYRKKAMDATRKRRPNCERRTQQEMVGLHSHPAGEFLVCDIEYTFKYWDEKRRIGRIDMVAAYRPRPIEPGVDARFALIELKYGAKAMDGAAGLQKHVRDLHGLMGLGDLGARAAEMAGIVEQKRALGLLNVDVPVFDLEAPLLYIIAVAKHRPRSQRLRDALLGCASRGESRLTWPVGVEARVAILDDDLLLRPECMLACGDIEENNMSASIFCGTKLKDRTPRAARGATPD